MRKRFGSIKFRVVAVVVLFTLASALASVALSLRHFQRSARQNLLQSTELTIQEISDRLRFTDQSYLGRYFKRHEGISPKEYRNNHL